MDNQIQDMLNKGVIEESSPRQQCWSQKDRQMDHQNTGFALISAY
jgi:hypothetical protein